MASVSDLIHSSFRLIGAIAAGETLETAELNDAFVSFNQMIGSWNTEGLSLAGRLRLMQPLTVGINSYLLSVRPVRIEAAQVETQQINCPLEIVDSAGWESITEKDATAVLAKKLFCDYLYPTSTAWIWPTPRMPANLEIFTYAAITPFVTVNDVIDLPTGYEAALRYNFAVALLPEYPRTQADPSLPAQAQAFKASLAQLNAINHSRSAAQAALAPAAAQGAA